MRKIRFHWSCFLLLAAVFILHKDGLLLFMLFAVLLHEAGHCVVLFLLGGKIEQITISVFGIKLQVKNNPILSYGKEFLAIAAGPFVNIAAAFFFAYNHQFTEAGVMLSFGVFNLLPVKSLDGGRLLHILFLQWTSVERADRIILFVSIATLAGLTFFLSMPGFVFVYASLLLSFIMEII